MERKIPGKKFPKFGIPSCEVACTQELFHLSFLFSLALAVNKSPAVYILSPALAGLWRENRGSVNRLGCPLFFKNFRKCCYIYYWKLVKIQTGCFGRMESTPLAPPLWCFHIKEGQLSLIKQNCFEHKLKIIHCILYLFQDRLASI